MLDELSIDNLAGVTGGSRHDLFAMMMMSQLQSTVSLMAAKTNNDANMIGLLSQVFSVMHGGAPIAAPPPGYPPPGYPAPYAAAPYPAAPYPAAPYAAAAAPAPVAPIV